MPIYRLIAVWNFLDESLVSYGYKQFSTRLSESLDSFLRFADTFQDFAVFCIL